MSIFGEVQRMVGPGEGGLQVAQQGVDREELLEFHAGRAATGDRALVGGVATVLTLLALPAMYAAWFWVREPDRCDVAARSGSDPQPWPAAAR